MKLWNKIKDAPLALYVFAASMIPAQRVAAQTADVLNPIKQVEDARSAAQKTTLDVDSAKSGAEKIADVAIVWAAPIGLVIALFGFYLLHKANQDESGRTSKGVALGTILIGGCTCVFSVLTFVAVEYIIGTK
ncbi:hypothetical protein [Brucella intermedia]|uniref:hypothetical protein n=1 Tax=Brucella intermedia TaxID=94625 RepID=UPI0023631306|nr:hypothetical protein [Brucella intermedia]